MTTTGPQMTENIVVDQGHIPHAVVVAAPSSHEIDPVIGVRQS